MSLKELFCRHDWALHGKVHNDIYQRRLGFVAILVGLVGTVGTFEAVFQFAPLNIHAIFLLSLVVVGFIITSIYGVYLLDSDIKDVFAYDKTCLKCDKLSFAATELSEKFEREDEEKRAKDKVRQSLVSIANERYSRYLEMRNKANG